MTTKESQHESMPAIPGAVRSKNAESHSAAGAAAGFTYQFGRALWWLATKPGSFSVAIETLDDICITDDDGSTTYEQDKYSIRNASHPVSDRAVALWKTLSNWLSMFAEDESNCCFLLVTNRPVPSHALARRISDAETEHEIETVLADLYAIAAEPSDTIGRYAEAIRTAPTHVLSKLVASTRLSSSDTTETEWAGLRKEILDSSHLPTSIEQHASSLINELYGWLVHCCMQAWHRGSPAVVTAQAFNNALHRVIDSRRRQHNRERPPNQIDLTASDLEGQTTSIYVKQLMIIEAEQSELQDAILDCVKYGKEVLRLTNTGEYTPQDWDVFEDELQERWKRIFARVQRLNASEEEACKGYRIYHETTDDYRAKLRGQETDHQYFSTGAYHRLADQLDVGWHPRYQELLITDGRNDGSAI